MSGPVALVDQGSTTTKTVLVDRHGETLATAEEPTPMERAAEPTGATHDGESGRSRRPEARIAHDAEAIAASVERLLDRVTEGHAPAAVGLICQRSTCLLWERDSGAALTPALSWQDTSAADRLDPADADRVAELTGLRLSPHYAASKLAALLDETPGARAAAERGEVVAGTLDAFLGQRLTGAAPATEPGHAGRTLLYDLADDGWSEELCALFAVPRAALPNLRPSVGAWGDTAFAAPLTAVAGDQQAALVGHGGWEPGVAAAHFGTGAFVLASTGPKPRRHPGLLTAVIASTRHGRQFQIEGSVNSAGSAVDWAVELTGEELDDWTDRPLAADRPPWLFPALAGAAAPWWRPEARGVLTGIALGDGSAQLLAAVLAGIAHRVVDCLEALGDAGAAPRELRVSGRLTRLGGLVQAIADLGRLPVRVSVVEEAGLAGLAALTRAGLTGEEPEVRPAARTGRLVEPALSAAAVADARERWRAFVDTALAFSRPG